MQAFEEHVYQLLAANSVPCFSCQHLKVTDVLVDTWEVEGEIVEACLGDLLFGGVCKLHLKSC